MKKGLIFSLKMLFITFLSGIFFSILWELIFLSFSEFLKIKVYWELEIFLTILFASFLTFIFSQKNIINHLFINGLSRKKILNVKILSSIIYGLIFFVFFVLYGIFYLEFISKVFGLNKIMYLLAVYFVINLTSEIATFFNFLYKNISIKKGKGINKSFYRYIYSFIFIVLTCIYRFIYPFVINYYNDILLIFIIILSFILQIIFLYVNKKWILNVDIRA